MAERRVGWRWLVPPLFIVLLVTLPWLLYRFQEERTLNIVVVDKTVPFDNYLEHRGFFGLLDQLKIRRPSGEPYRFELDYVGAQPGSPAGQPPADTRDLDAATATGADLLYLIDTYGVYEADLLSGEERRAALERSERLYGGLTEDEATAIEATAAAGIPIIAEFNAMASPTPAAVRERVEATMGVRWTRWIGRYFPALEDEREVPQWLRDLCQREEDREWDYQGAGYVVLQDDEFCEVLVIGKDTERIGLTIEVDAAEAPEMQQVSSSTPYGFWFEWVEPAEGSQTLASFEWQLTDAGRKKLERHRLPLRFPAVVRHGNDRWYFAGDFGDSTADGEPVRLAGFLTLRRWIEKPRRIHDRQAFFYRVYAPMMRAILELVEG